MRLITILMLATILHVSAKSYSQRVTISGTNLTFAEIFEKISQQTGYEFVYGGTIFEETGKISMNHKNAPLTEVLDDCFRNRPYKYVISDKTIVVSYKRPLKDTANHYSRADTITPAISQGIVVRGKVLDNKDQPLPGATVKVKSTATVIITGESGSFSIIVPDTEAMLAVSYVGFKNKEVSISGADVELVIRLEPASTQLKDVTIVNTGFQVLPKERATGSFEKVNNELFNRTTGPDVLSRLEGVTTGLLFDRRIGQENNIRIRGISTLTDQLTGPLVVVDNFPYDGDISNFNPNDIESITILKDAAAASIWGARAGNGVIVITTKKGNYNKPLRVSFNSNITFTKKPDLFYLPQMNSSDYIDVEKMLFTKGFYDSKINDIYFWPYLSPVVELLLQAREGTISQAQADEQINVMRKYDIRNDYLKYIYRTGIAQQYALGLNGGSRDFNYQVSFGYDRNRNNIVTTFNDRLTVKSELSFKPISKLEIQTGAMYTQQKGKNPGVYSRIDYTDTWLPYTRFAADDGMPLIVGRGYRTGFLDTVGHGQMLDWKYRPLAELKASSRTARNYDMLLNAGARYQLSNTFSADVKYQYTRNQSEIRDWEGQAAFYTRNLINLLTQLGGPQPVRPIPLGGILGQTNGGGSSYNLRGQINANKTWNNKHQLAAIAGAEVRQTKTYSNSFNTYGYDDDLLTYQNVDYTTAFPTNFYGTMRIPSGIDFSDLTYRYTALYGNASYTYNNRYIISASARKDASNLFGVNTNQKGVPLWSAGIAWNLSDEPFYKLKALPYLKLRATYGYQGNLDNRLSALSVIQYRSDPDIYTGRPYALINNPANADLRWEKAATLNLGVDFGFKNDRFTGSIEYYQKKTTDALSLTPLDLTTGFTSGTFNSASLKGNGVDVQLHSANLRGDIGWNTDLIFSYTNNEVTDYTPVNEQTGSDIIKSGYSIVPIVGKPPYSIFSYKWAGLDPETGDPRGILKGAPSKDYAALLQTGINDLQYNGSAIPLYYGSLRNTFTWKGFSLSANIIYKFGYYFRRTGLDYASLFNIYSGRDNGVGHADFSKRWQKPGDEKHTDVPSMIYPVNEQREQFYTNSSALVSKGDHIRLQDITFSYTLNKPDWYFKDFSLYGNINNIGIIWRANKEGLDPDYGQGLPAPRMLAIGFRTNF